MLNHSRSRSDSRSPFLHGLPQPPHAAAAAGTEELPRDPPMDPPSSSGRGPATPRRQLQGPRPPRLNVRMESHAIRKPSASGGLAPAAPAQGAPPRRDDHQQQAPPPRAPVIIYDASPKVIHAKPSEFMAIVQSLTGPGSGAPQQRQQRHRQADDDDVLLLDQAATAFLPPELLLSPSAAMSPAARLATIERSVRPAPDYDVGDLRGGGGGDGDEGTLAAVLGPARHPSILSPLPSALPPAAAPRNLLATPTVPSPTAVAEFFGSLPDL
ncbi:protein MKS1-like [Panicum miliaceum]|uniref:Protein MKS1-like n=1 Tax=Panicum miliaceum TaxID=4540 RepID=A0A3L6Q6Y2_PANMI|nr:protein MKS1-like [Panicum miliaceum]